MPKRKQATMWAIEGRWGKGVLLYCGTYLTRRDAIRDFCANLGKTWAECRKSGNRAVKVNVSWEARDAE